MDQPHDAYVLVMEFLRMMMMMMIADGAGDREPVHVEQPEHVVLGDWQH